MAVIFDSVINFVHYKKLHWASFVDWNFKNKLICTSGGFDILHVGHTRLIFASQEAGKTLIVIVNGDDFLRRKKGYVCIPLKERLEMVSHIQGVDYVVPWDDGSQYVDKAIELIRPSVFTKGGDRTPDNMAQCEIDICKEINCEIKYGVGGDKIQSSSWIAAKAAKKDS